jgi:hypothetical protein
VELDALAFHARGFRENRPNVMAVEVGVSLRVLELLLSAGLNEGSAHAVVESVSFDVGT